MIVLTEVLLNAFKYYSSENHEPVKLYWQHGKKFCSIACENPSLRSERSIDKGHHKGHSFLGLLARNLPSPWEEPLPKDDYRIQWHIPTNLLVEENE
jgi:hypothetical protein